MALQAIEPRRLYRQVADQLRSYLDAGEIPVGARMPTERELAEKLSVSRPTIREALIALEVEGRVRIRVGSGIYVAEPAGAAGAGRPDAEGPFEILSARSFIEGAVAAEAAGRIQSRHIEQIDAILARMANSRHPSDETVALDRDFHIAIAAVLGNAVIERTVRDLFDQRMSPYFGRLAAHFENEESWRQALAEHRAIRNALAAHDAVHARDAMRRHLEYSQARFSRSFGESDGEPDPVRPQDQTEF